MATRKGFPIRKDGWPVVFPESPADSSALQKPALQRLERPDETFSGRAVDALREMVLSGGIQAGERLNEVALANSLGISRGPLREAIQRLRSEGLLTGVPGRGSYVRAFTPEAISQLYEVRIALEIHALKLIFRDWRAGGSEELQALLTATNEALTGDGPYPSDLDFHYQMVRLSKNYALIQMTVDVHRKIYLARSRSAQIADRAKRALIEHRQVVKHLANSEIDAAVGVLESHLRASLENALSLMAEDATQNATADAATVSPPLG